MIIKPISKVEMAEIARQNFNRRHPLYQISAPATESGQKLAKKVQRNMMLEDVIKRVSRNIKWPKLV